MKMKKLFALILALISVFALAACGNEDEHAGHNHASESTHEAASGDETASEVHVTPVINIDTGIKEIFSADEDAQYHELFFDKKTDKYEGSKFTKKGIFAVIYDAYSDVDRYYVWGFGSEAKDCCYQWEFVFPEGTDMPVPGSVISVEGTMSYDEKALDKYWLTDVSLTTEESYADNEYELDFAAMSPTLMRVQMSGMLQFPEEFSDKSIRIIGKALSANTIGSAYANSNWSVHFSYESEQVEADDIVMLEGIYNKNDAGSIISVTAVSKEK